MHIVALVVATLALFYTIHTQCGGCYAPVAVLLNYGLRGMLSVLCPGTSVFKMQ